MIVEKKKLFFTKYDIYFAEKPVYKNFLSSYYMQAISKKKILGFKRIAKFTKLIDISDSNFATSFDKTIIYEIKRAEKELIKCEISDNINNFVSFYNNFAVVKGLNSINKKNLNYYKEYLVVTVAKKNDEEAIVYHSYLIDKSIQRVRLLHSTSKIHSLANDNSEKNLIGRANKLLHLHDMNYFNELGFKVYDFGGYAFGSDDKSLLGINKFKDSFGGVLIEESIYEAYLTFLLKKTISKIKNIIKTR